MWKTKQKTHIGVKSLSMVKLYHREKKAVEPWFFTLFFKVWHFNNLFCLLNSVTGYFVCGRLWQDRKNIDEVNYEQGKEKFSNSLHVGQEQRQKREEEIRRGRGLIKKFVTAFVAGMGWAFAFRDVVCHQQSDIFCRPFFHSDAKMLPKLLKVAETVMAIWDNFPKKIYHSTISGWLLIFLVCWQISYHSNDVHIDTVIVLTVNISGAAVITQKIETA